MRRLLVSFLIGYAGLAVVGWGAFVGLPWVTRVSQDHGTQWGMAALAAVFAACALIAAGLWRLQDRIAGKERGPRGAPDRLYCQRCGAPVPLQAQFCPACGGTRLGLNRPRATPSTRS
jgi:hypothetical protein